MADKLAGHALRVIIPCLQDVVIATPDKGVAARAADQPVCRTPLVCAAVRARAI